MIKPLSTNVRNFRWFIFLVALLPIVSLLSGCSASSSTADQDLNMAPMSDMPVDVQKAAVSVQEASVQMPFLVDLGNWQALESRLDPNGRSIERFLGESGGHP